MKAHGESGSKALHILNFDMKCVRNFSSCSGPFTSEVKSQYALDMKLGEPQSHEDVVAGTEAGILPGIDSWLSSSYPVLH
jgi:hypothetical protein